MSAPLAGRAMRIVGGVIPNATLAGIGAHVAAGATSALVRRAFGGRMDTDTVLADVFGNALGNSIVDGMSLQPAAAPQARGSSADELQEVQITPRYIGLGAEIANARLDNNPTGSLYQPATILTPDEVRAVSAGGPVSTLTDDLPMIGSMTVTEQRIRQGEDAGLDQWYFLSQYYRPYLTPQGQALVDQARDAAEVNYGLVQRYGRLNSDALNTLGGTYDLLADTSAGTGLSNLMFGYKGGPASLAERIIGTPIGIAGGAVRGVFSGTTGALDFTRDALGAGLYELSSNEFFASSYERYGATAAGFVNLASNPDAVAGAVGDYFSRIDNLYGVDPLNASAMVGRPVGEVVAPGVELMSVARGLRIGGEYALDSAGPLLEAMKRLELRGSRNGLRLARQEGILNLDAFMPNRLPTREGIVFSLGDVVQPQLRVVTDLDPDALVGFRGSLARGFTGEHKGGAPFNPQDFDVDAFIVSDKLAERFGPNVRFRSGANIDEIASVQRSIDTSLRQNPTFSGLRSDPFTFRVFTQREMLRLQSRSDPQYYFIMN